METVEFCPIQDRPGHAAGDNLAHEFVFVECRKRRLHRFLRGGGVDALGLDVAEDASTRASSPQECLGERPGGAAVVKGTLDAQAVERPGHFVVGEASTPETVGEARGRELTRAEQAQADDVWVARAAQRL